MTPKTVTPEVGVECWIINWDQRPIKIKLIRFDASEDNRWEFSHEGEDDLWDGGPFYATRRDAQIARWLDAQEKTKQAARYEAKCLEEIENEVLD